MYDEDKFLVLGVIFVSIAFVSSNDYVVSLYTDGPIVKGGNLTAVATLYKEDERATGTFRFQWSDDGIPAHTRQVDIEGCMDAWVIQYDEKLYPQGPYVIQVVVLTKIMDIYYYPIASKRIEFNITETLNGQLKLIQKNGERDDMFVSSQDPVLHRVALKKSDEYINRAPTLRAFWFVDCVYYEFTNDLEFILNYTKPEKHHVVEALVVADFTPLPPPTTTTVSPSTTSKPNTTTTLAPSSTVPSNVTTTTVTPSSTVPSNVTTTTVAPSSRAAPDRTTAMPTISVAPVNTTRTAPLTTPKPTLNNAPTTTSSVVVPVPNAKTWSKISLDGMPVNDAKSENKRKRDVSKSILPQETSRLKMSINGSVVPYDGKYGDFPYVCNASRVAQDEKQVYGYFYRSILVRAPISSVNVTGNNWLQHGAMLSLTVKCLGSREIKYCVTYKNGAYNITGNETCSYYQELDNCEFVIERYFKEPNAHTVVIIIKNDVSKVVHPVTVTVYKVQKQAQLSVIIVPVVSSIVAIVLIIFGVAYYLQNRSRFVVEVADFNFGQQYNDLEYKTFGERLKDSITNAFNRAPSPTNSEAPSWPPGRKYGSMT